MILLLLVGWIFTMTLATDTAVLVLSTISRGLSYYKRIEKVSDGFIFGLLLIHGQLNVSKFHDFEHESKLKKVIRICDSILAKNPRPWSTDNAGKALVRNMAQLKGERYPLLLRTMMSTVVLMDEKRSREESDRCILEMMWGIMSKDCMLIESDPDARGYTLSHQALYFSLAELARQKELPNRSILNTLCNKILMENNYIKYNKNLSEDMKDLFIEQIAVCGMNDYNEFITFPNLKYILQQQTQEGCFAYKTLNNEYFCEEHLSSVSMAALSSLLYSMN